MHYEARRRGEGEGRRGLEGKKTGDERGGEREREREATLAYHGKGCVYFAATTLMSS